MQFLEILNQDGRLESWSHTLRQQTMSMGPGCAEEGVDEPEQADQLIEFATEPDFDDELALSREPWQILVVDDDEDVHASTLFSLKHVKVLGRPLQFYHAYSAKEAVEQLQEHGNVAVILLDVVMESRHAGLDLVKVIRDELARRNVRIILRTGQPGEAPESDTIENYDINDYKTKGELTRSRLYASVTAAVRSYQQLQQLDESKREIDRRTREIQDMWVQLDRIREAEKEHIAREVHDEMGVTLTALNMELSHLVTALGKTSETLQPRVDAIRDLLTEATRASRRIISDLRPSILDTLGLVAAIEWQGEEFQKRYGVKFRLHGDGELPDLSNDVRIALFRIFQECLTNVAKYAQAERVHTFVNVEPDKLVLEVQDNGVGFDPAAVAAGHYGIMGMRERTHVLGGEFTLESDFNNGTSIRVEVPLARD